MSSRFATRVTRGSAVTRSASPHPPDKDTGGDRRDAEACEQCKQPDRLTIHVEEVRSGYRNRQRSNESQGSRRCSPTDSSKYDLFRRSGHRESPVEATKASELTSANLSPYHCARIH